MTGGHHHGNEQRGKGSRIRDCRAGQRRKDACRENSDIAETALAMADEGKGNVDDALRQAAGIHNLTGENEERHGDEDEAVSAVENVLCDDLGIEDVEIEHQRDAAEQQGVGDRHADGHGPQERTDEDCNRHGVIRSLPAMARSRSWRSRSSSSR